MEQSGYKVATSIGPGGKVTFQVPFPEGTKVEILVRTNPDTLDDLVEAASTSLGFWDNPWDDEDWNNA